MVTVEAQFMRRSQLELVRNKSNRRRRLSVLARGRDSKRGMDSSRGHHSVVRSSGKHAGAAANSRQAGATGKAILEIEPDESSFYALPASRAPQRASAPASRSPRIADLARADRSRTRYTCLPRVFSSIG